MTAKYCEICGEDAPIGVGVPVRWVCMSHFDEYLKHVNEWIKQLREIAGAQIQTPSD